jgi:type IV secretion system protein VirB9
MKNGSISYLWITAFISLSIACAAPAACAAAVAAEESGDVVSGDATGDAFDALIKKYQDILLKETPENAMPTRTAAETSVALPPNIPAPVQLPSRYPAGGGSVPAAEDAGYEDPKAAAFERKLEKLDGVPPIRPIDKAAITLAESYDSAKNAPKPNIDDGGRINFFYGTMNPRIVCRPLRLTDIELEPGEQITNVHVSDPVRWSVSGSWSGAGETLVTHVIVKPQLPDISANLLVHTDRRTYSIDLVSTAEGRFMPYVGFIYPEVPGPTKAANEESWKNLDARYKAIEKERTLEEGRQMKALDPANIYLNYAIKVTAGNKKVPWKPTAAYDIDGKTYIVMPPAMGVTEAPVMFVKQGNSDKLVNYRVEGNVYIVDRLFNTGVMVAGKDRVAIIRKNPVGTDGGEPGK